MLRPLFRLAASQPQLLADHLEAYSGLVASEIGVVAAQWKRETALRMLGYGALAIAALLGAIAMMLWAVFPAATMNEPWLLIAVPLAPAALGCWATVKAAGSLRSPAFATLRRQWAADAAMLHEAS